MNIVQHLILTLVLVAGPFVNAQDGDVPTEPIKMKQEVSEPEPSDAVSAPMEEEEAAENAEVSEDTPAPQASLLKTAANKDFNKALYFDQVDNGVILPSVEIDYEFSKDGKSLRMGNAILNEKNFFFALLPLGKTHPNLSQVLTGNDSRTYALVMAWPEKLMKSGTLEMISRTGAVLWSYAFTEEDRATWKDQLSSWRTDLLKRGVPLTSLGRNGIFGTQFAIRDIGGKNAPFWGQKDSFRFCISQSDGRNQSKLCSQRYGTKSTGRQVVMGRMRSDISTPRVLVQNEQAALKDAVAVNEELPASFYAELATGESYEFTSVPPKLELMDITDTKNPRLLRVVGYDSQPLSKSVILNPDQYGSLTRALGFESTIGDSRKFWAAAVSTKNPRLFFPGKGGGIFRQRFELSEIPRKQSRVYLSKRTPTGTYRDGIKLFGRKQPVSKVSSEQNSVEVDKEDPAQFMWRFRATERGQINRSYLNVEFEGKNYRSYLELYKGYPRELSGRITAVQTAGSFLMLGEVAYSQWFEDILTWSNYWVSRQRWGVSARYFQSFNNLNVNVAGRTAPLTVWNADLKYRLTPGLWGRDETVGGIVSYQSVTFDQLQAPMLGAGVFWARSMPKIFDDFFNLFIFMRYPKWVDMEFIYYSTSMDSAIQLNSSMALNFHGKVLWTERIFGEAGFGLKRYAFQNASLNQRAELNAFYGTVGLGINF